MTPPATKQKIIQYYNHTKFDYTVTWALGSQGAMHYGLWGRGVHTLRQALARENAVLAEMVNIKPSDRVLDAGCGVGGSSLFLARNYGCHVTGISIVGDQVDMATRRAHKQGLADRSMFQTADYTATSFPDNTFDVVWALESVCHALEKRDFLREAYRVLKPGGRLIVAEYLLTNRAQTQAERAAIRQWLTGWAIESLDTADDFVAKAQDVGFTRVKLQDLTTQILPSSKRMYQSTLTTAPFELVTRKLGWRGQAAKGNFEAARLQYRIFKHGLCLYGVMTAIKPAA